VGLDFVNKYLVSASLDGKIVQWDFYRQACLRSFQIGHPIEQMIYNRSNDLVAVADASLSIVLLSGRSMKKVREFPKAASNKITDICFSQPDNRWLLCSSLDKCVRVWDILTASLVDWVEFKKAPLSIDFAPSGEFLATSHHGQKGVYLWSNRMFF